MKKVEAVHILGMIREECERQHMDSEAAALQMEIEALSDNASGSGSKKAAKLIDANTFITSQVYDDEHETWEDVHMTIAEYLDAFTDEGCPEEIEEWNRRYTGLPTSPLLEERKKHG